jgi:hypothetical protein
MPPPYGMLRCQMRYCMRRILFIMPVLIASVAGAQTMTEVGASAAGSAIGSAAGKKVSDGITAIFGKVDKSTAKAAKAPEDNSKSAPLLEVGPGVPKVVGISAGSSGPESVPPPPPAAGHRAAVAAKPAAPEALPEIVPPPPPPPPPPPQMTLDDLKKVASGMSREDLLKLGAPVSRIMMDEDGHVLETFSYASGENSLGRVRLTDGLVSTVEIR